MGTTKYVWVLRVATSRIAFIWWFGMILPCQVSKSISIVALRKEYTEWIYMRSHTILVKRDPAVCNLFSYPEYETLRDTLLGAEQRYIRTKSIYRLFTYSTHQKLAIFCDKWFVITKGCQFLRRLPRRPHSLLHQHPGSGCTSLMQSKCINHHFLYL